MPTAVIELAFDPSIDVAGRPVLIETLVIAAAILVAIVGTAVAVRLAPAVPDRRLRLDDLLFIALGVVPGAVIGSRLGYVVDHLAFYRVRPEAILDPSQGGLELTLAVIVGLATGTYVARLIDAPVGRWAHASAVPVLGAIAIGKLGQALDGAGQGRPTDEPWATAYLGSGPWGSLAPSVASHPAQLYEAAGVVLVLALCVALLGTQTFRRDGRLLVVAIEGWLVVRFLVAFTWRDTAELGPLNAEQLMMIVGGALLVVVWLALARHRARAAPTSATPAWPDPDVSRQWRETRGVE